MSKVKTVETASEFQSLVAKSGLLDGDKLDTASRICGASEDPKVAARQLVKDGLLSNWQAIQLLGGFSALVMGNYKLLDQIGKGELGRVYLAEHFKMGNKVALKALAGKSASDPKMVERFLAEARAAGAFEHRNVLRVLDVASDQDRPFVVTEFVSGGDLQQRVEKSGPLPPRDAADFVAQTAEGMAYVHGKSVLHRDLKPANLLVDDKGVVKILDVGVGQLREAEKPNTENTGELLLSALGYMSPEQVRGKELDSRSDIYALGGTLYFVLTGRVPYTAASNEERDVIRKTKRPVPVSTLKPEIPAELAGMCDQMMALKSSDRPASMDAVAQRLRRYLKGETEAVPDKPAESKSSDTVQSTHADTVQLADAVAADLTSQVIETSAAATTFSEPIGGDQETADNGAESEPVPVAVVPAGPRIQKKKKAATTEAASSATEANSTNKAKRQRTMLIATAAVALLVVVVGLGVMAMLSGGSSPQVAQNETTGQAARRAEVDVSPAVQEANNPETTTEAVKTAEPPAVPAASPAAAAAPPAAASPAAAPAAANPLTTTPVIPANTTPPTAAAPTSPAATAPPVATATPAPAAPATAPPAAPTATPAAPAVPAVPPTTPATAATTPAGSPAPAPVPQPVTAAPTTTAQPASPPTAPPAAPKEEPAKATVAPSPAKTGKTFEIAAAVDLPRLPSADGSSPAEAPARVLGKINLDPKDTCFIALFGGEKAIKGRHQFSLRSAQGGTAPRDWEFLQKDPTGSEVMIATLALPAQELKFEWTPDGLKNPAASALRNCALKITAGQEKPQFVALRTATKAAPISVENLERSTLTAKFNLDSVPDGSALRLEPSVAGQKSVFDPGGTDITKGDQWLYLGEAKEQAPLALKLDTTVTAKGIQVTAVPHVLIPNEKPQKLTPVLHKRLSVPDMQRQVANLTGQLDAIKKLKKEEEEKLKNEVSLANLARENLEKLIQRVQKLDEIIQQLNGNGKIHFRVFYDAGETQIDLVKTDDNAPPAGK